MAGRTGCPPSLSHCLSYPFIRAFIFLPASTCKLNFLGLKTCPINPYLEWLGVVVKAEEHGSVRCRVLNDSNDSFPFVLVVILSSVSFSIDIDILDFFPNCSYTIFAISSRGVSDMPRT